MRFAELTQIALLGTDRQTIAATTGTTSLCQLESQVGGSPSERVLLSLAALHGLYERSGTQPMADNAPLPPASAGERQKRAGERTGSLLRRLLGGECSELIPEWLARAARSDLLAPLETLPALLNLGTSKPELREVIAPVLGERGRWLALQNSDWAWAGCAVDDSDETWRLGEYPARLMFLQRLRRTNPARARELLADVWKEEAPEDRAAFLATFDIGLAADDEPFLASALEDKRHEVRRAAAELLARLPDSALVKRQIERAAALLKYIPGTAASVLKLRKIKPAAIEVTLPGECDRAMQRDGIEPKPPAALGQRVWWLVQIIEVVPLNVWTRQWNSTPEEIVAASRQGEWRKELVEAWMRAAVRQRNAAWAEVLFDVAINEEYRDKTTVLTGLLVAMPPAQREERLSALLSVYHKSSRNPAGELIRLCRHEWSPSFSRVVLHFMRVVSTGQSTDWPLRNQFKEFAMHLAPAVLEEANANWITDSKGWEFWSKGVDEFLAVIQFRADMGAAFKNDSQI